MSPTTTAQAPRQPARARSLSALLAAVLGAALALTALPAGMPHAGADEPSDIAALLERAAELDAEHDDVDEELDALDAELDDQRAALTGLTDRLTAAEEELATVEAQLEIAEAELAEAEERLESAVDRHEQAEERLASTEAALRESEEALHVQLRATHRYGAPTYLDLLDAALAHERMSDVTAGLHQLRSVAEAEHELIEELAELEREHRIATARAEALRDERDDEQEAAERSRDAVADLHDEQAELVDDIEEQRADQAELVEAMEADREAAEEMLATLEADIAEHRAQAAREAAEAGELICAVPDGSFIDDWHFPRSGGRLHEGNDIFADAGAPIYAVAGGTISGVNREDRWRPGASTGLGGKTVSVTDDEGTRWYFAHLDSVDDQVVSGGTVEAGQQIGTVGTTGNARSTPPHLHLGRYVDGEATNPYPFMREACQP